MWDKKTSSAVHVQEASLCFKPAWSNRHALLRESLRDKKVAGKKISE
jgi:hypothetical protein